MPSLQGAFLQERWPIALPNSSTVGVVSNSTITGSLGRASSCFHNPAHAREGVVVRKRRNEDDLLDHRYTTTTNVL